MPILLFCCSVSLTIVVLWLMLCLVRGCMVFIGVVRLLELLWFCCLGSVLLVGMVYGGGVGWVGWLVGCVGGRVGCVCGGWVCGWVGGWG